MTEAHAVIMNELARAVQTRDFTAILDYPYKYLLQTIALARSTNVNALVVLNEIVWRISETRESFDKIFEPYGRYYNVRDRASILAQAMPMAYSAAALSVRFQTVTAAEACRANNVRLVKWLHAAGEPFTIADMNNAIKSGSLEMVQTLHHLGVPHEDDAAKWASLAGNKAMIKWMWSAGFKRPHHITAWAAKKDHFDLLIWLHRHGSKLTEATFDAALTYGNLRIVKYLHEQNCELNGVALISALRHAACVRYLHESGYVFPPKLIKFAPTLDALRFLHELGLPLNEELLTIAVQQKDLARIRYLFEHACPVRDDLAVVAARTFDVEIIDYLHNHGVDFSSAEIIREIVSCSNDADYIHYLRHIGCAWDATTYLAAVTSGNIQCCEYLRINGCPTS